MKRLILTFAFTLALGVAASAAGQDEWISAGYDNGQGGDGSWHLAINRDNSVLFTIRGAWGGEQRRGHIDARTRARLEDIAQTLRAVNDIQEITQNPRKRDVPQLLLFVHDGTKSFGLILNEPRENRRLPAARNFWRLWYEVVPLIPDCTSAPFGG